MKVFRQQRDLRFTPDKTPYKTRTYGVIHADRRGLYAELSARGLYAGTGYHQLAGDQLERFRAAVADERPARAGGGGRGGAGGRGRDRRRGAQDGAARLPARPSRVPALLRHKSLIGGARAEPGARGWGAPPRSKHVAGTWRAAAALNEWLETHVGPSELEPRRR